MATLLRILENIRLEDLLSMADFGLEEAEFNRFLFGEMDVRLPEYPGDAFGLVTSPA